MSGRRLCIHCSRTTRSHAKDCMRPSRVVVDLAGQRFGRLLVVGVDRDSRHRQWIVQCDCGAKKSVKTSWLKTCQSCGCLKKEKFAALQVASRYDLTGQRFGRLVAVEVVRKTDSGSFWLVRCDCGNKRNVRTSKLLNGEHVSCGCLRSEKMKEWNASCRVHVVDGKKLCTRCGVTFPVKEFAASKKSLNGLSSHCRRCRNDYRLKQLYGISADEHAALLNRYENSCGACYSKKDPNVDHDHTTGVVRGVLCGDCNRALGLLRDDESVIAGLLAYLKAARRGKKGIV